jgi:hypothetical protein
VRDADVEAIKAVRADLDGYARAMDVHALPDGQWPTVGALLINLRNILEALVAVADAQPVRVPAPTSRLLRQRRPVASTNPPR